jgi:hypothetical protein
MTSTASAKKAGRRSRCEGKMTLLKDVPRTSNVQSISRGGSSTKKEVARIMSAASGAFSPRMRRSFVDRRYLPSTGMSLCEWEIVLEELIRMGIL